MKIYYHIHVKPPNDTNPQQTCIYSAPSHENLSPYAIYVYVFQMVSFSSDFPTKTLYAVFSPRHVVCPAHLILTTLCEKYEDNISTSNL
jgi:hypothetical protein